MNENFGWQFQTLAKKNNKKRNVGRLEVVRIIEEYGGNNEFK